MPIKTSSAKAKGRNLQKWVRDYILDMYVELEEEDVRSTGMGQSGPDVQLSPAASKLFPYAVECKANKAMAIYAMYAQAENNSGVHEPLLVIKADRKKQLVVIDADHFFDLIKK